MAVNFSLNYALVTAAITLLGGILLFIFQWLIQKVFIHPIDKQKEVIENIATYLIHYSNLYANPLTDTDYSSENPIRRRYLDASNKTRELAALLKVRTDNIILRHAWEKVGYVLPRANVDEAYRKLIGLSNSYGGRQEGGRNRQTADEIRNLLKSLLPEFKHQMARFERFPSPAAFSSALPTRR